MLLVSFSLWKLTTLDIHCSPGAGLSGWMYMRLGISGSAFPATIQRELWNLYLQSSAATMSISRMYLAFLSIPTHLVRSGGNMRLRGGEMAAWSFHSFKHPIVSSMRKYCAFTLPPGFCNDHFSAAFVELSPKVAGLQINFGLIVLHLPSLQNFARPTQNRGLTGRRRVNHRIQAGLRRPSRGQSHGWDERGSAQHGPSKGRISDSCWRRVWSCAWDARLREAAHGLQRKKQLLRTTIMWRHVDTRWRNLS